MLVIRYATLLERHAAVAQHYARYTIFRFSRRRDIRALLGAMRYAAQPPPSTPCRVHSAPRLFTPADVSAIAEDFFAMQKAAFFAAAAAMLSFRAAAAISLCCAAFAACAACCARLSRCRR